MKQLEKTKNKILQVTVACMKFNQTFAEMTSDDNTLNKLEGQALSIGRDMDFIARTLAEIANELGKEVPALARKMAEEGRYE